MEEGEMRRPEVRPATHLEEELEQEHGRRAGDALPMHGPDLQGIADTTVFCLGFVELSISSCALHHTIKVVVNH